MGERGLLTLRDGMDLAASPGEEIAGRRREWRRAAAGMAGDVDARDDGANDGDAHAERGSEETQQEADPSGYESAGVSQAEAMPL